MASAAWIPHTSAVKHDLGKYVAMRIRWLPPDAAPDEVRDAVVADLLRTRDGPTGAADATTVWRELRPRLVGDGAPATLASDPDVARIDAAMATIGALLPALRGSPTPGEVEVGRNAAVAVSEACRELHRRAVAGEL